MSRRRAPFKLTDKRTGWYGEGCWRSHGRKFLKKLEHRHNRRCGQQEIRQELN
jgi:hypothetical protein